jgi:hypothetical protein
MRLAIKDATILKLLTKLPVGKACGVDLAKVLQPFNALLQEYELNLPMGVMNEPTQRIGAKSDGAPQLVIRLAFWTKEVAEAALHLDEGEGIRSPTFHAHLESNNGSRRGKYLVHGSTLIGLDHDQIQRLLCRLPRVSAVKVEPAYLYDEGPLRADAVVAIITHTGQLERCFAVSGFQPAVWLDRKVPRMPIVEMPPAGSSQPLPTRHLPKTAQWASQRPQQGEQLRQRDQPTQQAQRDKQPADPQPPHEQEAEQELEDMDQAGDSPLDRLAAEELHQLQPGADSSQAVSLSSGVSAGPELMDFARGQPKRPPSLAPPVEDEEPAKAARASTGTSLVPARQEDAALLGCVSVASSHLMPSIKEEGLEEVGRGPTFHAIVPSASDACEDAANEYRRVKVARDGLMGRRKVPPDEMRSLHVLSASLQVRIKDARFLAAVAEHLGWLGPL